MFNRATGKPFVMPSVEYSAYEHSASYFIPRNRRVDYGVNVKCLFYMPTHRKCDLTNLLDVDLISLVKLIDRYNKREGTYYSYGQFMELVMCKKIDLRKV